MNGRDNRTRVFLTGATGNMGGAGFRELYKRKDRFHITVLARDSKANRKKLSPYADDGSVRIIWGDLTDYRSVLEGVRGSDYVLHVGGMVSPQADYFPEKTMEVNVASARNIVDAVLAQPDRDNIKVVYIGSVAQCGDRLFPVHWGRTGDPVYSSRYDTYSVSKCIAEKIFADSGLKRWVSLRQSGILYPGILKNIDPIIFHVPAGGVLEWATIEDSGRLLANVCEKDVPEEFWNRFYNIGSGEQYRLTNYEFETMVFKAIGLPPVEKIFEPQWFATRNFHGMWYTDSDILENYLHFRENLPVEEYFRRLSSSLEWYYSLAKFVPAGLIKAVMKHIAGAKGLGTLDWIRNNDTDKIEAYYGSVENFRAIKSWEDVLPGPLEKNLGNALESKEAIYLDHGYDTSVSIYSLSAVDMEKAAGFRGGRFLGPADRIGTAGEIFEWECEHGHRFRASAEYVLLGGGWCDKCNMHDALANNTAKNKFISQVLSALRRE